MKKLSRLILHIKSMSFPAYIILKLAIIISIVMLASSLVILVYAGEESAATLHLHRLAKELYSSPAALMLVAVILSACLEEKAAG